MQARSFDGRTFAGIDLPAPPQDAPLSLAAARAWTWRDNGTERLFLDRDVRISLGVHSFRAAKAVVWLEPVRIGERDADQLALYLADVFDPGGAVGLSQQGDRLLITAVVFRADPTLKTDLLREGRPEEPFLTEAEGRLARHLAELTAPPAGPAPPIPRIAPPTPAAPPIEPPTAPEPTPAVATPRPLAPESLPPDDRGPLPPAERPPVEYPRQGLVHYFAENVEVVDAPDDDERAAILTGGVAVQYVQAGEPYRPGPTVQLSAERAVIFLSKDADLARAAFDAEQVLGVYLEGDVAATTGRYTLRGRRVFYDVRTDRAIILDAVFWTYDEARGMPLYLRADAIRQESRDQWTARNVRLANVAFAEPHFSIGATTITITNAPREPGDAARTHIDARGVTFRFGDVPAAYLPSFSGEPQPSILRRVSLGSEQGDAVLRTAWDLYAVAGLDPPEGNRASLLLDGYFNRGPAAGLDLDWRSEDAHGSAFAYYIHDDGRDKLPSGDEIKHDSEHRGMVEAEQVWRLSDEWTLFLEFAWISDETFVPAFFRADAETRREYASAAYFRSLSESSAFTFEVRGMLNDFLSNQYLLQSLGYTTQKLPEAAYHRFADELLGGAMLYNSEYRLSAMRLAFNEPTPREMGFRSPTKAREAFGLGPDDPIGDALRARGLDENATYRADTRHEVEVPLRWGPVNLIPFAVGRATAWDDNFDDFSGRTDNEPYRLWGSAGLRLATTIQATNDAVESDFFDLHRMRHLVEPSLTLWTSGANLSQNDLPIYDDDVESLATGTAVRAGVRNTWQTQRGGAGHWRSADWLVINTNYVWSSGDADIESPYGRFIEARPEHSNLGRYLNNDAVLFLTDSLILTNDLTYDFESRSLARISAGMVIDHGFGFSSLVEYRYLDDPRATLLNLGARYELTRKYALTLEGTIDAEEGDFQSIDVRLERRFPQWTLEFGFEVDNISDEVSGGVTLRPAGFAGDERTRVFTHDPAGIGTERETGITRDRPEWGPFRQ